MTKQKSREVAVLHSGDVSFMLHSPLGTEMAKPFARDIELMVTRVVGSHHVDDIEEILDELWFGDHLELKREPKNPYDDRAIRVQTDKKKKIGYIARKENTVLASLMDAGKKLYAEVVSVDEDHFDYVKIRVLMKD